MYYLLKLIGAWLAPFFMVSRTLYHHLKSYPQLPTKAHSQSTFFYLHCIDGFFIFLLTNLIFSSYFKVIRSKARPLPLHMHSPCVTGPPLCLLPFCFSLFLCRPPISVFSLSLFQVCQVGMINDWSFIHLTEDGWEWLCLTDQTLFFSQLVETSNQSNSHLDGDT